MKELYREIKINKHGLKFLPKLSLSHASNAVPLYVHMYSYDKGVYMFSRDSKGGTQQNFISRRWMENNQLKIQNWKKCQKGGSYVQFLGQWDACNSAPNGLNNLKFCMQGLSWVTI